MLTNNKDRLSTNKNLLSTNRWWNSKLYINQSNNWT